jgi:hypothetical protein
MTGLDDIDRVAHDAITAAQETGTIPYLDSTICVCVMPVLTARIRELEAREAETRQMLATWRTLCEQEQRAREAAEAHVRELREACEESTRTIHALTATLADERRARESARDAALEEAACVADAVHRDACPRPSDVYGQYPYRDGRMDAADDIGSDIRALKAPAPAVSDLGGLAKREAAK